MVGPRILADDQDARHVNFTPSKTCNDFMLSDAKMRVLMGPVGSGKSVCSCFEIIRRASEQEPDKYRIRRSRCAVIRQTVRQLQDTTIKTFLDWFPPGIFGTFMRTTKTYFFKQGDVECEILFRGLDDLDDVANLASLELTFAWVNEARDMKQAILEMLEKRIGRFPSMKDGGPSWHGVWADTNPPVISSYWYNMMEEFDPDDGITPKPNHWEVFKQPSGLSPEAENIKNLPEGYYSEEGKSSEYCRVFIHGQYGHAPGGTPVFKHFNLDYHVAKQSVSFINNGVRPIIVGVDLGLTPAAVFGQLDGFGRALVLDECVSEDMGARRFIQQVLKPKIAERFAGLPVLVIVDPAGVQRAQTDEATVVEVFKREGFDVRPASTNKLAARIQAVDDYLMRQVDGGPCFIMDPRCLRLKAAFMGGYAFSEANPDIIDKKGKRAAYHTHVSDAAQYLFLSIGMQGGSVGGIQRREIKRVDSAGWT